MLFVTAGRCAKPLVRVGKRTIVRGPVLVPPDIPGLSGEAGLKELVSYGEYHHNIRSLIALSNKYGPLVKQDLGHINAVLSFDPGDVVRVSGGGQYVHGLSEVMNQAIVLSYKENGIPSGFEWKHTKTPLPITAGTSSYLPLLVPTVYQLVESFSSLDPTEAYLIVSLNLFCKMMFGSDMISSDIPWTQSEWTNYANRAKHLIPLMSMYSLSPPEHHEPLLQTFKGGWNSLYDPLKKSLQTSVEESLKWQKKTSKPYICRLLNHYGEAAYLSLFMFTLIGRLFTVLNTALATTTHTLEWLIYNIAHYPEVQEKLYQEIYFVTKGCPLSEEQLQHLPYLGACIKETLRLHPPNLGYSYILNKDITLQSYVIPANVLIMTSSIPHGYDETKYSDPLVFKPERWTKNPSNLFSLPKFVSQSSQMSQGSLDLNIEEGVKSFLCSLIQKYQVVDVSTTPHLIDPSSITSPFPKYTLQFLPRRRDPVDTEFQRCCWFA